jgi:Ca2+-binding EF-hand superfamily protein
MADTDHFHAEKRRIKDAFEFFDREGRGLLVKEEVGTIMRYLGAFPSEEQLVNEILPQASFAWKHYRKSSA